MGVFKEQIVEQETSVWRDLDLLHADYLQQFHVPDEFTLLLPDFEQEARHVASQRRGEPATSLIRLLKVN